jgi:hypothetical protein
VLKRSVKSTDSVARDSQSCGTKLRESRLNRQLSRQEKLRILEEGYQNGIVRDLQGQRDLPQRLLSLEAKISVPEAPDVPSLNKSGSRLSRTLSEMESPKRVINTNSGEVQSTAGRGS